MATTEDDVEIAERRMLNLREAGYAHSARYDVRSGRVVVDLSTGVQIAVPVDRVEGLAQAGIEDLREIEISSSGLGLYWPKLDVDLYVPGLLQGVFGSKGWMASLGGPANGSTRKVAG